MYRNLLPAVIFLIMLAFLWKGLFLNPHEVPSALIGKAMPKFVLPSVENTDLNFSEDIFQNKITLANIWASWCGNCRVEHEIMKKISSDIINNNLQLVSINYKDNPDDAVLWLNKLGNFYNYNISDQTGSLALNLGVYGTPEMFLIDQSGVIQYRHVGIINEDIWHQELLPRIANLLTELQSEA